MSKLYVAFRQVENESLFVEYSTEPPNDNVFSLFNAFRKPVGNRLVSLANSPNPYKEFNDLVCSRALKFDENEAQQVQQALQYDLNLLANKKAGQMRQQLPFSVLLLKDSTEYKNEYDLENIKAEPIQFHFYNSFLPSQNVFTYSRVYVVSNLQELIAAEFLEYVEAVENPNMRVRSISKCGSCGTYFITANRSDTNYCSKACKEKAFSERVKSDGFYKAYKNKYSNVRRDLDMENPIIREIFTDWRKRSKDLLKQKEQFESPAEYLKYIGNDWKETKRRFNII